MIVFVHGVPETGAIWRKVIDAVGGPAEAVAVELPGFSTPRPEGFSATKDAYVDWLVGELEAMGEPVDLVGHDWGAGLTYRVATAHGHLLRSWAADVANIAHPDYEWHAFAKIWQTPGDGEAFFAAQVNSSEDERAGSLTGLGMDPEDGLAITKATSPDMGGCILDLYRSATPNPHAHWGPWSPTSAPGLVLHPTEDPFGDEKMAREVATALGAGFAPIEGAGHFWPSQAPAAGAAVLQEFWAGLA